MTVKQAAERWGCAAKTVNWYCNTGKIPGIRKVFAANKLHFQYEIPDDAVRPARQKSGPKPGNGGSSLKYRPTPKPLPPMTTEECEAYIRKNASCKTYAQLSKCTGLPVMRIRAIYERLHKLYGI